VTWASSVPILVFLGLFVLELGLRPMYVTDVRQTDVRQEHRLMSRPPYVGEGNNSASYGQSYCKTVPQETVPNISNGTMIGELTDL